MIERIFHGNTELALIIRSEYHAEGIKFVTPDDYSQQIAYMHHQKGKKIDAHIHNEVHRNIKFTQEVLIIRKGILRVDLYDDGQKYIESRMLHKGDLILLVSGGHGFEVIEEIEMIEVKQGPYVGQNDKMRFNSIVEDKIILK